MCGGSPGKLTTLTTFFPQWSTELDQWWFGQLYHGILSVSLFSCMVGSTAKITWTFCAISFNQLPRHYSLLVAASLKTTMFRNISLMWLRIALNWYEEHKSELEHIEWQPQSPDLIIIWHLQCILKRQVRNRYPLPPCLKELEQVCIEE